MNQPQGTANPTRSQRPADCPDCPPKGQPNQAQAPAQPSQEQAVQLTERELMIYQAGQSFGAAQALRQVAEQVNKLSQTINGQANAQAAAGQELLDRALGKPAKTQGDRAGAKLGHRIVKAVGALVGADD